MKEKSLIITQKDLDLFNDHLSSSANISVFNKTQLANDLRKATVVEESDLPADVVTMNTFVKLLDVETNQEYRFYLVAPAHANIRSNKVSCLAPIGMALFGYQTNAEIKWEMPTGFKLYRLLHVSRSEAPVLEPANH
ncbi:MAG TPA: GreA/GreB family elongation factor [Daejeonella sp.]|nr:GreA/GreB family elongation factor [Daejeonella sp.]